MEFDISYTSKEITPWGGMVFLSQMLQKTGFRELIDSSQDLPVSGSNRGHKTSTIIEGFIASIWCGANRFLHTEVTRHDAALGKIFGWKHTPGQDTYKRFFNKFTQSTNQSVSDHFYPWIFDNLRFDNFTLDIDSSVMTRYGQQEGAKKERVLYVLKTTSQLPSSSYIFFPFPNALLFFLPFFFFSPPRAWAETSGWGRG